MRIIERFVSAVLGLTFIGLVITCTQVEFDEEEPDDAPVITLIGPDPYILNIGDNYIEPGATAYDSIDGDLTESIEIDKTPDAINSIEIGDQYVTYTVENSAGRVGTKKRTVRVRDSNGDDYTKPVISLNGDDTVYVNVGETYVDEGAVATDDTDDDDEITKKIKTMDDAVNTDEAGIYAVWYMVSDNAGNVAYAVRIVVVSAADTEPPVITLNGPSTVNLDVGYPYNELGATAFDNVDGDLTDKIEIDNSEVDTDKVGVYKVYYRVSDNAGNKAEKTRTVNVGNVSDTVPPVITLKGDNPDTADVFESYNDPGYEAQDDSDGDITDQVEVTGSVDVKTLGKYELRYNVSDSYGNNAEEKVRTVYVVDRIAPELTIEGPNPINLDLGNAYTEYGATATDNYDGDLTSEIDTNNSEVNVNEAGKYKVYYTVSDAAGNETQEIRNVNVATGSDSVKPVITLEGANPYTMKVGDSYSEPGYTATDNVDGDITDSVKVTNNIDTSTAGRYWVRYNVSDAAGNDAEQKERTVNVTEGVDTVKPVITLEGANPYIMYVGDTYQEPGFTATDDVDGDITSKVDTTNNIDNSTPGNYWVRYNVSDAAGNDAEQKERTVTVNELNDELIWEDFEGGDNAQTTIAMNNFTGDDGYWYSYDDSNEGGESTMDPDPLTDTSFTYVVTSGAGYNNSKGLHIKFNLKQGSLQYDPYCAVGFSIKTSGNYYNLSKMKSFKLRAKGSGRIRVVFLTKMVLEWPDVNERWGHFGRTLVLSSGWNEFTLDSTNIIPAQDSQQSSQGKKWTDTDARDKVTAIEIQAVGQDGYVVELYLDDLKTTGITVQDITGR